MSSGKNKLKVNVDPVKKLEINHLFSVDVEADIAVFNSFIIYMLSYHFQSIPKLNYKVDGYIKKS